MTGVGDWLADAMWRIAIKVFEAVAKPAELDDEEPEPIRRPAEEINDDVDARIDRGEL